KRREHRVSRRFAVDPPSLAVGCCGLLSRQPLGPCKDRTMFVVTMTQRSQEPREQHVAEFHQELQRRLGVDLSGSRAADPLSYQQVFTSAAHVVETAMHAMRLGTWNVGIGIGAVVEDDDGDLDGSGIKAAAGAVSLAAKQGQLVPLRVARSEERRVGKESRCRRGRGKWKEYVMVGGGAQKLR